MVLHALSSLAGAIVIEAEPASPPASSMVWSTFYDIRRYGGLQIFLRAALTGKSLVLSSATESTADFLARAGSHGVTHISGTPSQWRRALMSPSAHKIAPRYVRLSGEIADQVILDRLRACYQDAAVAHVVAQGSGELMVEHGVSPWDVASMQAIVEEAGGRFSNWDGSVSIYRRDVLASNGKLHDTALQILGTAHNLKEAENR